MSRAVAAPLGESSDGDSGRRVLVAGMLCMGLVLAVLFPATRYVAVPWVVAGRSMEPTLHPGDRVLVDLWTYRQRMPRPGEVALLVGPGDTVLVKRVARPPGRLAGGRPPVPREATLWIVGDNPELSADSREFGPVARDRVRGRVVWRYWPPSRVGSIR